MASGPARGQSFISQRRKSCAPYGFNGRGGREIGLEEREIGVSWSKANPKRPAMAALAPRSRGGQRDEFGLKFRNPLSGDALSESGELGPKLIPTSTSFNALESLFGRLDEISA
ncbi:hypothetical protein Nepgr_006739 [Nepenthes gracilis]|uniref:Uncharacterized protein n=1 Tax=Nepenthes gracilis TaxID=150966 RepID=A0AAD3S5X0_NEPGR|nr:hypothetical protein Nepgr_006739 [Nepenthes gracilis]